jgi:hypothetical protein
MKVARTVLGGGNFSDKTTYLNRPYAALLLLITGYNMINFRVKGNCLDKYETPLFYLLYHEFIVVFFYF